MLGRLAGLALAIAANVAFFQSMRDPILRFASTTANEVAFWSLALALPWLAGVAAIRAAPKWRLAISIVVLLPLVLWSIFLLIGEAMHSDGRSQDLAQFDWNGSRVTIYRTWAGATVGFGVEIRQDRRVAPGLLLVRRIDGFYRCWSLDAVPTTTGIRLSDPANVCQTFVPKIREYRLSPSVY